MLRVDRPDRDERDERDDDERVDLPLEPLRLDPLRIERARPLRPRLDFVLRELPRLEPEREPPREPRELLRVLRELSLPRLRDAPRTLRPRPELLPLRERDELELLRALRARPRELPEIKSSSCANEPPPPMLAKSSPDDDLADDRLEPRWSSMSAWNWR